MSHNLPFDFDTDEELSPLPGPNSMKVSLNFTKCRKKFQICDLEKSEKVKLIDTIEKASKLTWHDMTQAHRHGLGKEDIHRKSIKVSIPSEIDNRKFHVIRFDNKKPLIGYYENGSFMVIWIDRSFKVYNH